MELELGFQGIRTESALVTEDPVRTAIESSPDAIVLGGLMPTPYVFDVLVQLSQQLPTTPVVFINGTGIQADAALALEMGADDVLSRPFNPEDLGLRLRALLDIEHREASQMTRGRLKIDYLRRVVWNGTQKLNLGSNEWALLAAMAQAEGCIPSSELLLSVWGPEYVNEPRFLSIWIDRLRANLGDDPNKPEIVLGDLSEGFALAQ